MSSSRFISFYLHWIVLISYGIRLCFHDGTDPYGEGFVKKRRETKVKVAAGSTVSATISEFQTYGGGDDDWSIPDYWLWRFEVRVKQRRWSFSLSQYNCVGLQKPSDALELPAEYVE